MKMIAGYSPRQIGLMKQITLDYFKANACGYQNAKPIQVILASLGESVPLRRNVFQTVIIGGLRDDGEVFIGWCHGGLYLVVNEEDRRRCREEYSVRIDQEVRRVNLLNAVKLPPTGNSSSYYDEPGYYDQFKHA
jgi:hypothetical protein